MDRQKPVTDPGFRARNCEGTMTADEHKAMELTGQLSNLLRKIVGNGPQANNDWAEIVNLIHPIQHLIMAQAAARSYPDKYRILGG